MTEAICPVVAGVRDPATMMIYTKTAQYGEDTSQERPSIHTWKTMIPCAAVSRPCCNAWSAGCRCLPAGRATCPPERTLRDTIAWSRDLFAEEERRTPLAGAPRHRDGDTGRDHEH